MTGRWPDEVRGSPTTPRPECEQGQPGSRGSPDTHIASVTTVLPAVLTLLTVLALASTVAAGAGLGFQEVPDADPAVQGDSPLQVANTTALEGTPALEVETVGEPIVAGENDSISVRVTNEATVPDSDHPAEFHRQVLSAEGVTIALTDTYDTGIETRTDAVELGSLAPGENATATVDVAVPAELAPGEYLLAVTLQYEDITRVEYTPDGDDDNVTEQVTDRSETYDLTVTVEEPRDPLTPLDVFFFLLPGVPLLMIVAWLSGKRDERIDGVLTRVSRVVFARFVSRNAKRKRRLEAAYVTTTYQSYAAKTLLFSFLAFVGGAIAGAYLIAGLLAVLEPIVHALAGLPDTITRPIGIRRDFTFEIARRTWWLVLVGGGLAVGVLSALLCYVLRWQLPASDAAVRAQGIEEGLPRTTAFMFALARGGMEFPQILRTLTRNREVYGEAAREMNVAVREMDMFGRDMITALRRMARRTPSEQFKTFAENMTSILQSGSDLPAFFEEQYERFRDEQEQRQEEVLELLATIAEMYVTVLVAGMLFLITILLVFGLLIADTFMLLVLLIYLVIPLGNGGFALVLQQKLDQLGISNESGARALEHVETTTPIADAGEPQGHLTDGGHATRTDGENRRVLALYDRVKRVRRWLQNPISTFLWNPTKLLWVTVPIALLVFLLRAPGALQAEGIAYRVLDDLVIQSALFVLVTYAVVRWYYKRRINRIEAAMPEMLDRLASLNEAGMSLIEGFDRIRETDLDVLTPEIQRIWRDIEYGANIDDALVRFGRRVRTIAVTRVVTLLRNAMRSSGDLGPILRIASEQARAEVDLRRQRQQKMMTYLVVIYVSFLVFLVIVVAVNEVLVPSLPETVPAPSSDEVSRLPGGANQFEQLGNVNKAAYTLIFFHGAMIQAACAGFIAGQLGEGSLRDGAKHAAVMVTVAYVAFILLTSPVASITVTEPTTDGEVVQGIEEVSLSEGGFVAVYQVERDGLTLLGTTEYLSAGTHSDVVVPLQRGSLDGDATVRIVAHRDTNGNEQFDGGVHSGALLGVDGPYESLSDGGEPGIETELTFIDANPERVVSLYSLTASHH